MPLSYAEGLEKKVDLRRINLDALKPWIADRIARLVTEEDACTVPPDVAIDFCYKQLSLKNILLNGHEMQQNISTLIQVKPAQLYMSELWPLLLSAQNSPMGIPVAMVEAKKREILARQANRSERDKIAATIDNTVNKVNEIRLKEGLSKYNVNNDNYGKDKKKDSKRSRSRSRSRSNSKKRKKSRSKERNKSRSRSRSKAKKRSSSRTKDDKKSSSRKRSKSKDKNSKSDKSEVDKKKQKVKDKKSSEEKIKEKSKKEERNKKEKEKRDQKRRKFKLKF